jgi:uncharacterized protein
MPRRLLDANVILRFLTNDPPEMAARSSLLFEEIRAGSATVIVEDIVLGEVIWTLRSHYKVEKAQIAARLATLLAEPNIVNADKETQSLALALFARHNLGFADALLSARALVHGDSEVISFDRGIDRVPGIRRREP